MASTMALPAPSRAVSRPVLATAAVAVLWCIGFAAVNVVFEIGGHFAGAKYDDVAGVLTVMDWTAAALKLVGAAVAVLSVVRRPPLSVPAVGVLVWGAFATLGIYAAGAVAEGIAMVAGVMSHTVRPVDMLYVLFFVAAAAAFGVLAVSYRRRHHLRTHAVVAGIVLGPVALAAMLVLLPALVTLAS